MLCVGAGDIVDLNGVSCRWADSNVDDENVESDMLRIGESSKAAMSISCEISRLLWCRCLRVSFHTNVQVGFKGDGWYGRRWIEKPGVEKLIKDKSEIGQ